ncbi:MAG: peptide chain release factor-like protein [Candidatus Omnitrophica bacterium]|nr:peptide chain release factor-like protein [Candidatus Omnitrophota bacterium]MCM8793372.1 peptide chain release factor-like protein [Candidatus Omnitrophota bacterium]
MDNLGINPEKMKELSARMYSLGVLEKDLEEKFVRSSGKGGQKVNKVSSCVYLKHIPTGIEVKCSQERSQVVNRFLARRILADKIEALLKSKEQAEKERLARIRREKRRRSGRTKEQILREKHLRSQIKALRRKVSFDGE